MARQATPIVSLSPSLGPVAPPGVGHNGGPPLDASGSAFLWRRAVAGAWKTPSREIALRRLRRAEQLGLSYREYTSVLMDRGRNLDAVIVAPGALLRGNSPTSRAAPNSGAVDSRAIAKLADLSDCHVLICAGGIAERALLEHALSDGNPATRADAITRVRCLATESAAPVDALAQTIRRFLADLGRCGSEAFMVGASRWHLAAAEREALALFTWSDVYFGSPPSRSAASRSA